MTPTHSELQDLIGAYVVDAVDPDERRMLEDHLATCPRCRAEVNELREVTAVLGTSGASAPDGVWDRIVSSLEEEPPPMRLAVTPLPLRRRRWPVILAAAAAVLVVIGGITVAARDRGASKPQLAAIEVAAAQALGESDARLARLRSDFATNADVAVTAVVRRNGEGYLFGKDLPPLDGRIYQLWGQTPTGVVSLGVLNQPGVIGFSVDPTVSTLMISEEDHQVDQPQHTAVLSGALA
jgi:anti-sigma factor RsiW